MPVSSSPATSMPVPASTMHVRGPTRRSMPTTVVDPAAAPTATTVWPTSAVVAGPSVRELEVGARDRRAGRGRCCGSVPTTLAGSDRSSVVVDDHRRSSTPLSEVRGGDDAVGSDHDAGPDRWWSSPDLARTVTTLGATAAPTRSRHRVVDDVARVGDDRRRDRRAVPPAERAERHQHQHGGERPPATAERDADRPTRGAGAARTARPGSRRTSCSSLGCTQGRSSGSGRGPLGGSSGSGAPSPSASSGDIGAECTDGSIASCVAPTGVSGSQVGAPGRRRALVTPAFTTMAPCYRPPTATGSPSPTTRCRSTPPPRGRRPRGSGAVVVFLGVVRDHSEGRDGVTRPHLRGLRGRGGRQLAAVADGGPAAVAAWSTASRCCTASVTSRSRRRRSRSSCRRRTGPRRSRRRGSASTR